MHEEGRADWLRRRLGEITSRARDLDHLIARNKLPEIYGHHSFPEAERFAQIEVVKDRAALSRFLNTAYRCFVEPLDKLGERKRIPKYFWVNIKENYPDLYEALLRIRVCRNHEFHMELKSKMDDQYRKFVETDFGGRESILESDGCFLMQQTVLEELLVGFHCEMNRYS